MSVTANDIVQLGLTTGHDEKAPRAKVHDLRVTFDRRGVPLHALRGVSMEVQPGEVLALVGESGSGKSVMGLALLGLLAGEPAPTISGRAEVCGIDMVAATGDERRRVRKAHLGAVFQDPMTSLDPTMRVGRQVSEATGDSEEARRLLDLVGVPDPKRRMKAFPHELSGGLRQRVMIAMAVAGKPDLVIADEPTTALDVTVQAQVLGLLRDLCDELGTSFIVVTHDIGVASQIADRVAVMYGGRVAELGSMDEVLRAPSHPYTVGLLNSRLDLDLPLGRAIHALPGQPPDPREHPKGCAFSPRCPSAISACSDALPEPVPVATHSGLAACIVENATAKAGSRKDTPLFRPMIELDESRPALQINGIDKRFPVRRGFAKRDSLHALRHVILDVGPGESIAVVGESGSGKSTLLRVVAGLMEPEGGTVNYVGSRPQMVFQDAGASLTPWMTVGEIVGERLLKTTGRSERRDRVEQALRQVGLPPDVAAVKATSLSGGQRQRVALARAIIVPPRLLLCDEPTSALDASLAASVLNLLQELRRELGMAVMFVTHDLAAARFISDRIAVMYLGQIVEVAPTEELINNPQHPYTKALLAAVPTPGTEPVRLPGEAASPLAIPTGCAFHPRCAERVDGCATAVPTLVSTDGTSLHLASCLLIATEEPSAGQVA
ncbi:ABC transporter ATP-binding protein [Mycolicibacterium moriokaense]|uniref:Peptide/nickel transport system ATP-binding protein n=1 Tax=Mycolicibacterium moriokaense TaxID=39691 RepID=A0A318HAA7_9MYCO|nr:ABC transporter ATP-binding protein [Mycolicibacterium moriokaense]PXX03398.1 peptide/nickel transport system ATP-binding protein [Mycolicibacterium moriokaense]